jgi:cytochrome P450
LTRILIILQGITFTYTLYQISRHPIIQAKLRTELLNALTTNSLSISTSLPHPSVLERLPLLHAVIKESNRLRNTYPTSNPRVTPDGTSKLGPYNGIPGGVRVVSFAYSVHRDEEIFSEPLEWRPERWLDEDQGGEPGLKEREIWFCGFGSGSRNCVGMHLAMESK